ncbi:MAG: hypothetical protein SO000_05880 [Sodaliphilus sp.]|nr:hypothetical protein [Sodaliphilus sp.]
MTTSNADIQRLIDRFMSGQTSIDEEARLAAYFRTHDVPDEWADYKGLFAYFDAGMPADGVAVSGTAAEAVHIVPWWRRASRWAAAAAVIAAVVAAALRFVPAGSDSAGGRQSATVAQLTATANPSASVAPAPATPVAASEFSPHIAQAVKADIKAGHVRSGYLPTHEVPVPTADGVAEYSEMVVAAEYDRWLSRLESDSRTQQAMALMEQGAAVAVMCSDSGDVPEEVP